MFRLFFNSGKSGTFRPVKHAAGSKQQQFSDITLRTLGTGDLIGAVKLPQGEDLNEWLAANTVDFFNEIRIIWDIISEVGVGDYDIGKGFPPGFEYRWSDPKTRQTTSCSGPQYVELVMRWVEAEINNAALFPTTASVPFPKNFVSSIKVIYTRLFRIFAIIYAYHFAKLEMEGAASHLNTSFKHFLYFVWEYDLIQENELEALTDIVKEIKSRYLNDRGPIRSSLKK